MLLDQHKHKQTVSGVKDALLPAWSTDGTRLAWVQKTGRKKYTLVWATVSQGLGARLSLRFCDPWRSRCRCAGAASPPSTSRR